jgi:ketosteroid isomerase-like protein
MPYAMCPRAAIPPFPAKLASSRLLRGCAMMAAVGALAALASPCAYAARGDKALKEHKESKRSESREIEGLEATWRDAMTKGDVPSLDRLLSDDFLAISASGTLSDKQQYLHRLGSRQNAFSVIEPIDMKVRILPDTAIVTSQVRVVGQLDSRPINGIYRYTKVYRRGPAGQWRVLNFEATRVSGSRNDDVDLYRGMPLSSAQQPSH